MPTDPTRSTTPRNRVQRRFHSRWRTVRGDVRRELTGGSYYRPRNDVSIGRQASAFREWFESELDQQVVEPVITRRQIERGDHWTGQIVREFYEHGIKLAHEDLRDAGLEHPALATQPDAVIRNDDPRFGGSGIHDEYLAENYDEIYQDVVDAARETAKQAYREYRDAIRSGATVSDTIDRINDRIEKVGSTRTDLVAQTKLIQTINDAILGRYEQLDIEQVGVEIEDATDGSRGVATDGGLDVGHGHADTHAPPVAQHAEHDSHVRNVFQTAGDSRVCPDCQAFEGNVYTVEEIRAGSAPSIPQHPRCRCRYRVFDVTDLGWV